MTSIALNIPSVGKLFGWVWRSQTIKGARVGHAHFPTKVAKKSKTENTHHNSDFFFLNKKLEFLIANTGKWSWLQLRP